MVEELVNEYFYQLVDKEHSNGGFPDTQAMRDAIFDQVAFQYEQRSQRNYNNLSAQIIFETQKKIQDHINDVKAGMV